MKKTEYCIIGLGRFGSTIAEQLKQYNRSLMAIDIDQDIVQKASNELDVVVRCDATDLSSLKECAIKNITNFIVATSSIDSTIMICANLQQLGVKNIIAKVENTTYAKVLKAMGISHVVIPQVEVAHRIAMQCIYDLHVEDITLINDQLNMIRLRVQNEKILHIPLHQLDIRKKHNINVILIQRKNHVIFPITPDTQFEQGDVITIICEAKHNVAVIELFTK